MLSLLQKIKYSRILLFGPFGENLERYGTNNDNPSNNKIQLIRDAHKGVVYVGTLGLKGGGGGCYIFLLEGNNLSDIDQLEKRVVHVIKTLHVSCQSYRPLKWKGNEPLGGIILYSYKGKFDWRLNGMHCKSGYIILKKTTGLREYVKRRYGFEGKGMVHGDVYASVFGSEIDESIVGGGFSYY